ncbi:MAG: hypothetical protein EAZ99_19600 [Alphaproteobacteria bacterium]|nr:M14-type cytosolic carboxypeptidase [Alphaproteobacteria bacterium]TAD86672.1 MAG: hypothetical protein EAZ99_19600 [Alphaproteobacteria bacterium]
MTHLSIDALFDGGNIRVIDASNPSAIKLAIRPDAYSAYYQWFFFRVSGARGIPLTLQLTNAGGAAYPRGWTGYRAVASTDRRRWTRVATEYRDGVLTISLTPDGECVWVAYFAPYTGEDLARFLGETGTSPLVQHQVLGHTLDGRPMDCLAIDSGAPGLKTAWIVARQHPGETMASWFIEGLVSRLIDPADTVAAMLRRHLRFFIVPNMNPDGSARGHLRTNAAGVDLNREWETPSHARSPEVALVRERMIATGVDYCLDVHGDEANPHCFHIGTHDVAAQTPHMTSLFDRFLAALVAASPDFHAENGGWRPSGSPSALTLCSRQVANRFQCLASTLEMPFKDEPHTPGDPEGWSAARSRALGAAHLDALAAVVADLRPR